MRVADLYHRLDAIQDQMLCSTPGEDRHFIDYAHGAEGVVLYHGSVSDLDGVPKSTWTYEDGGQKVRRDQPIDEQTFRFLWWDGIAGNDVFQRHFAADMAAEVNPFTHHVIGIAFTQNGKPERCIILVPADESDPAFLRWLVALNVPKAST
ncbi:hypothetical protein AYO44_13825 [Planctomycetaceae bacterium SCGC AG-212-F19]|nr:hypothetical protein AYO44_13825 [Planctomycetaceae bacterium SCGC AG-212-F19]